MGPQDSTSALSSLASKRLYSTSDHELPMPIPHDKIDIDPELAQKIGYSLTQFTKLSPYLINEC